MSLLDTVREMTQQYRMIPPGALVTAGVSGGADSVCLLDVLSRLRAEAGFCLQVVHVEHGVRGEESLEDARFVERMCRSLEIPCFTVHVDMYEEARRTGKTPEEAGRDLRYRAFARICQETGSDRIAVAHNADDQAETVLMNLSRGSGLRGLGGIRPVNGTIIRPLLGCTRQQIESWLREKGIPWREDSTNESDHYTRNRVRHKIVPMLEEEVNPAAALHIAQAAQRLSEAEAYIEAQAQTLAETCIEVQAGAARADAARAGTVRAGTVRIDTAVLAAQPTILQEYLFRLAIRDLTGGTGLKDISAFHIRRLCELTEMPCGHSLDLAGGIRAWKEDGTVCLQRAGETGPAGKDPKAHLDVPEYMPAEAEFHVEIGAPAEHRIGRTRIRVEWPEGAESADLLMENKYTKWVCCDTINRSLCLRTRRAGDYLIVNRSGGKKKLKDYMIDEKIPRHLRDHIMLLADGSRILWVVGYRISEDAKVTPETEHVMRIQLTHEEMEENNG